MPDQDLPKALEQVMIARQVRLNAETAFTYAEFQLDKARDTEAIWSQLAALLVDCPTCEAIREIRCSGVDGVMAGRSHQARYEAAGVPT